jgi:hypothetical protein
MDPSGAGIMLIVFAAIWALIIWLGCRATGGVCPKKGEYKPGAPTVLFIVNRLFKD